MDEKVKNQTNYRELDLKTLSTIEGGKSAQESPTYRAFEQIIKYLA